MPEEKFETNLLRVIAAESHTANMMRYSQQKYGKPLEEREVMSMARRKKVSTAQPFLLSVADVAIQLGVCRTTVYNYIYHEGLPSIVLRGVRRVHPETLGRWLKSHEQLGV